MWGVLGLGLSFFVDAWKRNTPEKIEAIKRFYFRQKKLLQMDEWERRKLLLLEMQRKEGLAGDNMYRKYFIEWSPYKFVRANRFELEMSEAYCKSDLSCEVFIAEYLEGRIEEILRRLNVVCFVFFTLYDEYGRGLHCSASKPYNYEDGDNYYNIEVGVDHVIYGRIPRRI